MEKNLGNMLIYKKIINKLFICLDRLRSSLVKKIILLRNDKIYFGKNVYIGKRVIIKTTDGGKININDNVTIEDDVTLYSQYGEIIINSDSFIGKGTQIISKSSIKIGRNNLIASYCVIRDSSHGLSKSQPINTQEDNIKNVLIKDDVWIGTHSVITYGRTIETGGVVGANSLVSHDVKEYEIVGGVPAKTIKKRI